MDELMNELFGEEVSGMTGPDAMTGMVDGLVDDMIDSVIEGMVDDLYRKDGEYKRTVMVVDDDEASRRRLGSILESEYEVLFAKDGGDALYQIGLCKERLSLVILDLWMPGMDGYGVLQAIRSNEDMQGIPVVVLVSDQDAKVRCLSLGAAGFFSKTDDKPEVILAKARRVIELSESVNTIKATENDSLTGLYTREFFYEYGHQFDFRFPAMETDAVVLDFNRFHLINELYGHQFGDQVLFRIAEGIRDVLSDREGLACRYDADTFYLYVEHTEDYQGLLDSIYSGMGDILRIPEVGLRMGVYADTFRSKSFEDRFAKALQACNSLRRKSTSAFAVYDHAMHEKEIYSARLLKDFEAAIEQKQFKVLYQPKYNVTGDRPVLSSGEALISWMHPEFGRVSPGDFIPLFEENGLIQRLDRYVWSEAAAQVRKWKEQYGKAVPVSVNVSRVDVYDPDMVEFLTELIEKNQLSPGDYLLEVTESAYTDSSRRIVDVVNKLRAVGFKVEMDDFGSSYSSLNMLITLPIDALKLDMIFVRNLKADSKEMRMVKLVMSIADYLDVPVIAEGVENQEQLELLKGVGCQIVQGYYFSRPVLHEEFGDLIAKELEQAKGEQEC